MHITLSGYYGFDNAGDEALLSAITSSISRLEAETEFTVFSGDPQNTRNSHGIPAVYYLNIFKVIKTIKNTDLLISGGGSIFQDISSGRSLPYYISVVALALFFNKPVVFYAQGVGPINRGLSKFLMRLIGNHATIITLRDRDSMDYLHSIGVNQPPMKVTADPVFALQPTEEHHVQMERYFSEINTAGRQAIGVSLREWPTLEGFRERLAALLDGYYDRGYNIIFIPMSFPDDISAGEKVASLMRNPSIILRDYLTGKQLLSFIVRLKLLIGMRLHSLIFAANMGVPLVGISYDPKVDSFLKILGQEPLQIDEGAAQIDEILNQEAAGSKLNVQALDLRQQADENARLALALLDKQEDAPDVAEVQESLLSTENRHTTGRNFIWVSAAIFFSKVLGFFRQIIFAATFGTTVIADAFQTIFGLPQLLFTSIGNSLSAVNIPDLTDFINKDKEAERKAYIANLSAQITLFFSVLSLLGIVLAPLIIRLIAPGLEGQTRDIAIILCKIMMPCLLFVNLQCFSTGILQAHRFFLLSSIISIPFNLIIILALFLRGDDIIFIGYMMTAGWFLQFLIQYPQIRRIGYRLIGKISFASPQARNLYRNILPILIGYSVLQMCLIIDRRFGTFLPEGSSAALAFGSDLFLQITSIFVMAMSVVVFPRLSKYCQANDFAKVRELLGTIFQILLFVLLPYILLIVFYHQEIITIVYERGEFDRESTIMTSTAFLFYSFVAVGYACQEIFNRAFYAFKQYRVPMFASLGCIVLNTLLNLAVYRTHGIAGISLTTAVCMLIYAVVLFCFLRKTIGSGMGLSLMFGLSRCALPLAVMLLIILGGRQIGGDSLIAVILTIIASGAAYLAVAFLTGFGRILKRQT